MYKYEKKKKGKFMFTVFEEEEQKKLLENFREN
jgi:hypothetical protein